MSPSDRVSSKLSTQTIGHRVRANAAVGLVVAAGALTFASPALAVTANTAPATSVTFTSATLHGSVNPEGVPLTHCEFEYTNRAGFGIVNGVGPEIAPCVPTVASIPPDSTTHAVSAEISDLIPGQEYQFRLVSSNTEAESAEGSTQAITARAAQTYSNSFSGTDTNALSEPVALAVDDSGGPSQGDVYVSDPANHRVEKFTPSGEFILMIGKEVDKTAVESHQSEAEQDVCTAASGDDCQAGTPGTAAGAFTEPQFLAVDDSAGASAGDLYVGDRGATLTLPGREPFQAEANVQKFDPQGDLVSSWAQGGRLEGADGFHFVRYGSSGLVGIGVDTEGNLFLLAEAHYFEFSSDGKFITDFGEVRDIPKEDRAINISGLAVDSEDGLYAEGVVRLPPGGTGLERIADGGTFAIDPLDHDVFTIGEGPEVEHFPGDCASISSANPPNCPTPSDVFGIGHLSEPRGLAVDDSNGKVYVADSGNHSVEVFDRAPYLPAGTASATPLTQTTARFAGTADPAGAGAVLACNFQYGTEAGSYNLGSIPCRPVAPLAAKMNVTAASEAEGLESGTTYHYRLLLEDENGSSSSFDQTFTTFPKPPQVDGEFVSDVHADTALIHAEINPGGGGTAFHTHSFVEYVTAAHFESEGFNGASVTKSFDAGSAKVAQSITVPLASLTPGTSYRYRVVAENSTESTNGATLTFTTFPFPYLKDPCSNAHVRQQTGAALLLDCRAYELVSAPNTAGYDVESNLVPGQTPIGGFPEASGRLLYSVHDGGIPGTGDPTNHGLDPYLATRGEAGWSTEYVGIPANGTPSTESFASTLLEANPDLTTFAFGGPGICSPCFADGSSGTPLRLPGGELVQGMAGTENPGPGAREAGYVVTHLSANGEHLIFGSADKFEPDAQEGQISIYDRNLHSMETHVVSKAPHGGNLPCISDCQGDGIAELGVSADGSHILIGQLVSQEGSLRYWHLYMSVDDSGETIDLTPGAVAGVLFDGMTEDGTRIFFTSKERLTAEDEDRSADLYEAELSGSTASLKLISTGSEGSGNTDSCDPVANSAHPHWNTTGAEENCGIVAIGGGGGVAARDGSIYFLSPERLDGSSNGVQNAPNLYLAQPADHYSPRYVTTLESLLNSPQPPRLQHIFRENLALSFSNATALAVEHSSGDLYVLDSGTGMVEKFNAESNPVKFTAGSGKGTNQLDGSETPAGSFAPSYGGFIFPTQLGLNQSNGDFYVPDTSHNVIDRFTASGEYLSQFPLSDPTAAAVDPANGDLYASGLFGEIKIFSPAGESISDFRVPSGKFPSSIAVDSGGTVYVTYLAGYSTGGTEVFTSSGEHLRTLDPNPAQSVTVDPSNSDVYVDEANQIVRFDRSGNQIETVGSEHLSGSVGLAIDPEGSIDATNSGGAGVALFPASLAPDPRIDNPVVIDSVSEPEARHTADFQLTRNGDFAAFGSTLALAGHSEQTAGHTEVYRYDVSGGELNCASCTTTGEPSTADSSLASNGLSLTDDGRLFFNSGAQLTAADTDGRQDVYEFSVPGLGTCSRESPSFYVGTGDCLALISSGTSPFDSGLLSATADGTDAFFFTRDSLAPQDTNGPTMKIYDAREGGGFPFSLPEKQCQASDECHGAGSTSPGPLELSSQAGIPDNSSGSKPCARGFRRRHGACVKKPPKHRKDAHRGHHDRERHGQEGQK